MDYSIEEYFEEAVVSKVTHLLRTQKREERKMEQKRINYINNKKAILVAEVLVMRLLTVVMFAAIVALSYYVWLNYTTIDILYLICAYVVLIFPISVVLFCILNSLITKYGNNYIRKIKRIATRKFR